MNFTATTWEGQRTLGLLLVLVIAGWCCLVLVLERAPGAAWRLGALSAVAGLLLGLRRLTRARRRRRSPPPQPGPLSRDEIARARSKLRPRNT